MRLSLSLPRSLSLSSAQLFASAAIFERHYISLFIVETVDIGSFFAKYCINKCKIQ